MLKATDTNIDTDKVLEVLNGLEIVEEGAEGYILVENSKEVHEKLNALGVTSETINKYGDHETFCIITLAFTEGYANDFVEGKLQKDKWIEQKLTEVFEVEKFEKLGKENDHIFKALVFLGEASSKLSLARTILKNNVAVEQEKMEEMLKMQTWVHEFSQHLRSIEKDGENIVISGRIVGIVDGASFITRNKNVITVGKLGQSSKIRIFEASEFNENLAPRNAKITRFNESSKEYVHMQY